MVHATQALLPGVMTEYFDEMKAHNMHDTTSWQECSEWCNSSLAPGSTQKTCLRVSVGIKSIRPIKRHKHVWNKTHDVKFTHSLNNKNS
jgi:hypothetical protein